MRCIISVSTLLFMLSCCAFPAHASYIRMLTRFTTNPTPDGVRLRLFIKNTGDEAAHAVQCMAAIASTTMHTDAVPVVHKGLEIEKDLFFKIRFPSPGRYPLVIKTVYQDKNGHRFSVVSGGFYVHEKLGRPELIIGSAETAIPEKGQSSIDFIVRNSGKNIRDISFQLHLPDELVADNAKKKIALSPDSSQKISFMITSLSALEGSSYAVWLLGEYEDTEKNLHYTGYGTGMINIRAKTSFLMLPGWVLIGADFILIILFILFQFQWLIKRKRQGS
ncbi:hypothetical protein QUF76_12565 [Desulfobacterales bacterium HSG16]|nr:hypothetical protein [Desulfobacterales bacterium HSG16]